MLAGERFSKSFEVTSNTAEEITVSLLDGPLDGIAVDDLFILEQLAVSRARRRSN